MPVPRRGRLRLTAGLALLAPPAVVWAGAAYDELLGRCDPATCGDRNRGWFMLVLVTAPLIPLGLAVARIRLWRLVRAAIAAVFVLLAVGLAGVALGALVDLRNGDYPVNLDDPDGSRLGAIYEVVMFALAALWCLGVAASAWLVGRGGERRYPWRRWPRSGRST